MTELSLKSQLTELVHVVRDTWHHLWTKPGIVITSAFLAIIVWGPKGDPVFSRWVLPNLEQLPMSSGFVRQLLSFATGLALLVAIPLLIVRFGFKEPLRAYGLGLGDVRLGLTFTATLIVVCALPFTFASADPAMQREYPLLYQGLSREAMRAAFDWRTFAAFELAYAAFFFIVEFTFRGYLLFGLRPHFGEYATLIQMLSYTAWHLPKPVTELLGTPLWGFAVAAATLRVNSLWYVFAAHWILNVYMDTLILLRLGVIG
jgi:hypothetical protein